MKVLIVDDEKIVLDSVKHMLSQNYADMEVETARNGKEGLLKLELMRPELVLTDIRMPGMTGLDFIREARKLDDQVHFVIVTAFDQFEYAREAFKYRVEDYVLKPLTKQKLKELVDRSRLAIKNAKEKRFQELESIDRLYRALQMVENNFFYSLMAWGDFSKQVDIFRELLSLKLNRGAFFIAQALPLPKEANWQQSNAYFNRLADACIEIRTRLKYAAGGLVSDPMGQSFYGYVEGISMQELMGVLETAYTEIIKRYGIKLKIVYSEEVLETKWPEVLKELNLALEYSQRNVEALSILAPYMAKKSSKTTNQEGPNTITSPDDSAPSKMVAGVIEMIKAQLTENLSLEEVAKALHISSPYLSKIFKEQTGKTFSGYITDLRIERSKALLTNTQLSIKEVGFKVGYHDPNYFVRLFKKVTGYTPTEYQKVML